MSIRVGLSETIPLRESLMLAHEVKVVLPPATFRAVVHGTVFGTYAPVAHSLDEQCIPYVYSCIHSQILHERHSRLSFERKLRCALVKPKHLNLEPVEFPL